MAAAGGGLPASAAFVGASPWAVARCRFPGRPWTPRSRLKPGRRVRLGRSGLEAGRATSGEQRPGDVEDTLREDPTLLQLLKLGHKLAHKREAGFYSSDEVSLYRHGRTRFCSTVCTLSAASLLARRLTCLVSVRSDGTS